MGSYLTVVNDTPDDWMCKVGPDMKLLLGFTIVAAVLAVLTLPGPGGLISFAGLSFWAIGMGLGVAFNVPANKLMVRTAKEAIGSVPAGTSVTDFGIAVRDSVISLLEKKKYHLIKAGERKRYGKMTLSLRQQCECIKPVMNGVSVTVHSLYMRPIFSGPKDKSNRDYSIGSYIAKYGTRQETLEGRSGPPPKPLATK